MDMMIRNVKLVESNTKIVSAFLNTQALKMIVIMIIIKIITKKIG